MLPGIWALCRNCILHVESDATCRTALAIIVFEQKSNARCAILELPAHLRELGGHRSLFLDQLAVLFDEGTHRSAHVLEELEELRGT